MFPDSLSPDDPEADRDLGRALREGSPETLRAFVLLAVLIQAGLLTLAVGVLLVVFRGQRAVGGSLVVGGLLALAAAVGGYRRYRDESA